MDCGKRIRFKNDEEYVIKGVVKSPGNSHLNFNLLLSYPTLVQHWDVSFENSWGWYDFYNYIKLKPGTDPENLEKKFPALIEKEHRICAATINLHSFTSNLIQEAGIPSRKDS